MRYGFVIPNNVGIDNTEDLIHLGIRAEELGYNSIWVNHHVLHVGYVKDRLGTRPYQDALTVLTWIAARTKTIKLGTSVLVMPYLHPMVLAKQIATLDQLSNGRLIVGLGAGSLPDENALLGVPYETRGSYCDEFIQVMKALWTDDEASFSGNYFDFDKLCSSPKPVQQPHPPVVVGGNRPPALRRAARYGDGWHPMNVSPGGVFRRMEILRQEAAQARREPISNLVQVRLGMERVNPESASEYQAAGVTDLVMHVLSSDTETQQQDMERFAHEMFH